LDPGVDVEMLEAMDARFARGLSDVTDRGLLMGQLEESLSNTLQLSSPKGCLTEDPRRELEELASLYLETESQREARSGWKADGICPYEDGIREGWVWEHMRHGIEGGAVHANGRPLKIGLWLSAEWCGEVISRDVIGGRCECGEGSGIQLSPDCGRNSTEGAATMSLTAVVEDGFNVGDESIKFAIVHDGGSGIKLVKVNEMPPYAELARQELHL